MIIGITPFLYGGLRVYVNPMLFNTGVNSLRLGGLYMYLNDKEFRLTQVILNSKRSMIDCIQ